ncbi:hypothetical protein MA16_Dca005358 [Dendrobium catenatum]|uniref:Uncharacterized protein n=1 Tax=Dendrobium catenatum TaxID=906689 RepID=A0A2I0X360_9ASPA|nr:hypothetical protein MA16_Dca005358 [Dendrobium catenatum]
MLQLAGINEIVAMGLLVSKIFDARPYYVDDHDLIGCLCGNLKLDKQVIGPWTMMITCYPLSGRPTGNQRWKDLTFYEAKFILSPSLPASQAF